MCVRERERQCVCEKERETVCVRERQTECVRDLDEDALERRLVNVEVLELDGAHVPELVERVVRRVALDQVEASGPFKARQVNFAGACKASGGPCGELCSVEQAGLNP